MSKQKTQSFAVGAEVSIFEDPATRTRLEGRAIITAIHDIPDYYQVKFVKDGYITDRLVLFLSEPKLREPSSVPVSNPRMAGKKKNQITQRVRADWQNAT
jgi:hypothetical protein